MTAHHHSNHNNKSKLLHKAENNEEDEEQVVLLTHKQDTIHDKRLRDNETLLEKLKARDCHKNVNRYKEELAHLKYLKNPFNVTMSHSNID